MFVYDEADELFVQDNTVKSLDVIYKSLAKMSINQQNVLFSATFNDIVVDRIKQYIGETNMFPI
jgi:superfamily II DNA/RNA helicase